MAGSLQSCCEFTTSNQHGQDSDEQDASHSRRRSAGRSQIPGRKRLKGGSGPRLCENSLGTTRVSKICPLARCSGSTPAKVFARAPRESNNVLSVFAEREFSHSLGHGPPSSHLSSTARSIQCGQWLRAFALARLRRILPLASPWRVGNLIVPSHNG